MTKNRKKGNHYVNNAKFYECIVEYKKKVYEAEETGDKPPRIPEFAGECIVLIAYNTAKIYKFSQYSYKEEMISDAILNCVNYFDSFNEKKYKNPHAYFTMICMNSNVHRINLEKKLRYALYKAFENDMILSGKMENEVSLDSEIYDNMSEYICDWEKSHNEKKMERKRKAAEKKKREESLENFME